MPLEGVEVFVIREGVRSSLTVLLCNAGAGAVSFVGEGEPLWQLGVLVGVTKVVAPDELPRFDPVISRSNSLVLLFVSWPVRSLEGVFKRKNRCPSSHYSGDSLPFLLAIVEIPA